MPDLATYISGGCYLTACRFANIDDFLARLQDLIPEDAESLTAEQASRRIHGLADELAATEPIRTDADAYDHLLADDLRRIADADLTSIAEFPSVDARVTACGALVQEEFEALGLPIGDVAVRLVENFPEPFHRFAWAAFAPDSEDEENFKIPRGVYFRKDKLRPFYSEALYAHEVVHTITGRVDPHVYAMGLEEGIAEVVGTCRVGGRVLPAQVVRNILVLGRHGVRREKLWTVYLEHTRQAALLYDRFGMTGLTELVRRGRAAIHEAERAVLLGTVDDLELPRGGFDPVTTSLLDFICRSYTAAHVFSPLECQLVRHVRSGRDVGDICREAHVDTGVGVPVLERLGGESALFVQDGRKIAYSNAERYLAIEEEGGIALIRYLAE